MKNPALATYLDTSVDTDFVNDSFYGPNHTPVVIEDGVPKVQVLPYTSDQRWSPVPAEFRSSRYKDPVKPGTVKIQDGKKFRWEKDKGYVETGEAAGPKASYNSDGSVATAGFKEDGSYVELDGSIWWPDAVGPQGIDQIVNDFLSALRKAGIA